MTQNNNISKKQLLLMLSSGDYNDFSLALNIIINQDLFGMFSNIELYYLVEYEYDKYFKIGHTDMISWKHIPIIYQDKYRLNYIDNISRCAILNTFSNQGNIPWFINNDFNSQIIETIQNTIK